MSKTKPENWTKEDLKRIFDAVGVLQDYDLNTTSVTMDLTFKMPEDLELEEST